MSDLTATNCGCGCSVNSGSICCSMLIWLLLLSSCCGGCGNGGEKDLYYHLPGFGYTPLLRVWPASQPDGSWLYTLPRFAGQGLRLDLADSAGVRLELEAIVLNERLPAWRYFVPSVWQLFWLAALPGLAGCAVTLKREKGEEK